MQGIDFSAYLIHKKPVYFLPFPLDSGKTLSKMPAYDFNFGQNSCSAWMFYSRQKGITALSAVVGLRLIRNSFCFPNFTYKKTFRIIILRIDTDRIFNLLVKFLFAPFYKTRM